MLFKMSSILRQNLFRKRISKSIFTVAKPTPADEIIVKGSKDVVEETAIATMNDLPMPCGSWAEYNKKRQQKYNRILFAGIITMVMSLALLQNSDGAKLFKNLQYIEDFDYDSE